MSSVESHLGLLDSIVIVVIVRKGCVMVSFVVWNTEKRLVPCVCSVRFMTWWSKR